MATTRGDPFRLQAAALAAVANAVVITDRRGTIEWVNAAFTRLSGYSAAEAVGQTPRLLKSDMHPDAFYADLWATIMDGRVWRGEMLERHKDGHHYRVAQTITPLRDGDGQITHFIAVHEDVTEAYSSRQRLQALFQHAHDAILLSDDDGRYVDVNPAACELLGYDHAELLSMHESDLSPPGPVPESFSLRSAHVVAADSDVRQALMLHRSGRVIETECRAVANILPGLHLSVVRDVSRRNASIRALAASEARFRGLAENASEIVALIHVDDELALTIDYINPASRDVFGAPVAEGRILASSLIDQAHPDDRGTVRRLLDTRDRTPARGVVRLADADDRWVWIEAVVTLIATAPTHRTVQLVARDVTEQQRLRVALQGALEDQRASAATLEALNETKNRLLRNVSHELRTPVTSIVGFAELLSRPDVELDASQVNDYHLAIRRNADRIHRLIDDLTDIDHSLRGTVGLHLEPTDLAALVAATIEGLHFSDHQVTLELAPVVVAVDADKVRRIIDTLATNAVRHTAPGTRITIRLDATDEGAELTVEDEGLGMPIDSSADLFEPFQQGEPAGRSAQPGLGLGLAIVKAYTEAHGGRVWVDWRRPGTCIHIALPHARGEDSARRGNGLTAVLPPA